MNLNTALIRSVLLGSLLIPTLAHAEVELTPRTPEAWVDDVCATCHGASGQGNPVVAAPKIAGMEPWYLKRQLIKFRDGLRGTGPEYIPALEMRAVVTSMSDENIDALLPAIRNLKQSKPLGIVKGDAELGEQLFAACSACHGRNGEGMKALGAPALANKSDWYLLNQLKLFKSGGRGSHPGDDAGAQMRAAVMVLEKESDLRAVVSYINTL